jgi:hypothetical protein
MRRKSFSVIGALGLGGLALGCAGTAGELASETGLPGVKAPVIDEGGEAPVRPYRPGETPVANELGNEKDSEVGLGFEKGYLNQNDVNEVLEKHVGQLTSCYDRAGAARKYAAGSVTLRFLVGPTGQVDDVLVVGSELGNYMVERCLVVEGRKLPFAAPGGGRGADFEYSVEFRSTRQHHVVERPTERLRRTLAARMRSLGRCGAPGEKPVDAVAYIMPNGKVVSVGLQSTGRLDTIAAMCVVGTIRRWRLPGDKGHLVRTSFPVTRGRGITVARAGGGERPRRAPR